METLVDWRVDVRRVERRTANGTATSAADLAVSIHIESVERVWCTTIAKFRLDAAELGQEFEQMV
jgi:hypothetical protein